MVISTLKVQHNENEFSTITLTLRPEGLEDLRSLVEWYGRGASGDFETYKELAECVRSEMAKSVERNKKLETENEW